MGFFGRWFKTSARRARRAEAEGRHRDAAAAYAEAGDVREAARALRHLAASCDDPVARRSALMDALRWIPEGDPERAVVEGELGAAELSRAQAEGVHTAEERRRLEQAAAQLEAAGQGADAASAWELLDRRDEAARCLEAAGEVQRLEELLRVEAAQEGRSRALRDALRDHDAALRLGARREALQALERGLREFPDDDELLRCRAELRGRLLDRSSVELRYDGRRVRLIGVLPVELGREGELALRGSGISRRHARIDLTEPAFRVRDLDSRNGTTVDGLLIDGEMSVGGAARVGLGDALHLEVKREGDALTMSVLDGLDRGLVGIASRGELCLPGFDARFAFPGGIATLIPARGEDVLLGEQKVVTPIELLADEVLHVGAVRVEVCR